QQQHAGTTAASGPAGLPAAGPHAVLHPQHVGHGGHDVRTGWYRVLDAALLEMAGRGAALGHRSHDAVWPGPCGRWPPGPAGRWLGRRPPAVTLFRLLFPGLRDCHALWISDDIVLPLDAVPRGLGLRLPRCFSAFLQHRSNEYHPCERDPPDRTRTG